MFDEIINELKQGHRYFNQLPYPRKHNNMKEGYITDENKSVKWNIEQVTNNVNAYKEAVHAYNKRDLDIYTMFAKDVIKVIMYKLKCTESAALVIFNKGYEAGHSDGYENVLYEIEKLVDFISDFNEHN